MDFGRTLAVAVAVAVKAWPRNLADRGTKPPTQLEGSQNVPEFGEIMKQSSDLHTCMTHDCDSKASDDFMRCIACSGRIKKDALAIVQGIRRQADAVYVGRSNYPERRLLEHFTGRSVSKKLRGAAVLRDRLTVLHWTGSWREAAMVEEYLIRQSPAATGLPDLLNSDAESWGSFSGPWNCVYVSWAAGAAHNVPSATPVQHLHGPLRPPQEAIRIDFIVGSDLREIEAAGRELDRLQDRRDRFQAKLDEQRAARKR